MAPIEYLTTRSALHFPSGEVLLVPAVRMKVPCKTSDDDVTCTMNIGSWSHDKYNVNLVIDEADLVMNDMVANQRWNLVDSSAELKLKTNDNFSSLYPNVAYTFTFQRRSKKCFG